MSEYDVSEDEALRDFEAEGAAGGGGGGDGGGGAKKKGKGKGKKARRDKRLIDVLGHLNHEEGEEEEGGAAPALRAAKRGRTGGAGAGGEEEGPALPLAPLDLKAEITRAFKFIVLGDEHSGRSTLAAYLAVRLQALVALEGCVVFTSREWDPGYPLNIVDPQYIVNPRDLAKNLDNLIRLQRTFRETGAEVPRLLVVLDDVEMSAAAWALAARLNDFNVSLIYVDRSAASVPTKHGASFSHVFLMRTASNGVLKHAHARFFGNYAKALELGARLDFERGVTSPYVALVKTYEDGDRAAPEEVLRTLFVERPLLAVPPAVARAAGRWDREDDDEGAAPAGPLAFRMRETLRVQLLREIDNAK